MEFWNSTLTEKSWNLLQEFRKKYNFILIGGWAVYLWTRQLKSKDIDVVVDIPELEKLKKENLSKNDNLKKYEIKTEEIDIDIYLSHFSKLAIPPEDIKKYSATIENFKIATPEALLVLKQSAELERMDSVKGEKDRMDIISLLFFSDINLKEYKLILKKYSLINYLNRIIFLLKDFREYNLLNLTPREFKIKKEKILKKLKML